MTSPLWKHSTSGEVFRFICEASFDTSGATMVVYEDVASGSRWCRPAAEFYARCAPEIDPLEEVRNWYKQNSIWLSRLSAKEVLEAWITRSNA